MFNILHGEVAKRALRGIFFYRPSCNARVIPIERKNSILFAEGGGVERVDTFFLDPHHATPGSFHHLEPGLVSRYSMKSH